MFLSFSHCQNLKPELKSIQASALGSPLARTQSGTLSSLLKCCLLDPCKKLKKPESQESTLCKTNCSSVDGRLEAPLSPWQGLDLGYQSSSSRMLDILIVKSHVNPHRISLSGHHIQQSLLSSLSNCLRTSLLGLNKTKDELWH